MSQENQEKYGAPKQPPSQPPRSDELEKVEQAKFAVSCKERGWRPVWHRTDKRSTANRGCPDFIVAAYGITWWIEFKRPGEELRPDQAAFKKELSQNDVPMYVVHSAQEAVDLIEPEPFPPAA